MTKPIISYYGGKQRIASKIVEEIYKIKHSVYVEPFAGGLAVLYAKGKYERSNSDYREAINDLNKCLVIMYRVARHQPDEFARLIGLTPYSQEEYRKAKEIYFNPDGYSDLDIAWATYIQCNMSFANKINGGWGTSVLSKNHANSWLPRKLSLPESLDRLKDVYVGCEDALDFIDRWDSPHTLFYCDPPYPGTNQGHYKGYSMNDFENLCNKLDSIQGSYILSNYPQFVSPKSAQKIVEIDAVMSASKNKEVDNKRTEVLWICDRSKAMREDIAKICVDKKVDSSQLSLF